MAGRGLGAGVLLLPLMALPYIANPSWLGDPDRIGFPVSVGFVLLDGGGAAAVSRRRALPGPPAIGRQLGARIPVVVAGLLLWTLPLANENRQNYQAPRTSS